MAREDAMADGNLRFEPASSGNAGTGTYNLALEGAGAHGPFAWGVLDRLLADPRIGVEAIGATGAGAINAAVLAYGLTLVGRSGARAALANFWRRISHAGLAPRSVRTMLEAEVEFERLRNSHAVRLQLAAVHVRSGRLRLFEAAEVSADVVMACASTTEPAEVNGEAYVAFAGSATRSPFFVRSRSREAVVVRAPARAPVDHLPCGLVLGPGLRAVRDVSRSIDRGGVVTDALRRLRVHPIDSPGALAGTRADWGLMTTLRDVGRARAEAWIAAVQARAVA
jgi:NTE family protein